MPKKKSFHKAKLRAFRGSGQAKDPPLQRPAGALHRPKGRPLQQPPNIKDRAVQHLLAQMAALGISPGQRVGVAVSGGADSVALLRLLLEVREEIGIVLSVAHFNHKLRGKASDADEKFVERLAAEYGLTFHLARENIAAKAKELRANLEETARRSRYAYFERLAADGRVHRVAVAHTADDQAETVLSHILRGTGIAGLAGIHPEAGVVFRPLLKVRRAELREYLRSVRQNWREDLTNRDLQRTRARIRRKLIPFLEKQFQPAVVEHLCQLADLAREDDAWMESAAKSKVSLICEKDKDGWRAPARDLVGTRNEEKSAGMKASATGGEGEERAASEGNDKITGLKTRRYEERRPASLRGSGQAEGAPYTTKAISKRMIRMLVKRVKPRAGQLSAVHVEAVLRLAEDRDSGKSVHLPGGVEVRRERDSLVFLPLMEIPAPHVREPQGGRQGRTLDAPNQPKEHWREGARTAWNRAETGHSSVAPLQGKKRPASEGDRYKIEEESKDRGSPRSGQEAGSAEYEYQVDLSRGEAELRAVEHSWGLRFQVIDWPPEGRETKKLGAVLDRDKLSVPVVVRNWRPGDALQPQGHQKRHKLSRLLNELGVSRWQKGPWPVLTCGGKIAWCRGLPVAVEFAVDESTRKGVVVSEVRRT